MAPDGRTKVFISWSKERSKTAAVALRDWLPEALQQVDPWMSEHDIESGSRWANQISGELGGSNFGVICVTPENREEPWIHFEAGALSKLGVSRVVPLLLGGLSKAEVTGPLSQFQSERADDSEGVLRMLQTLNNASETSGISEARLKKRFEAYIWPKLKGPLTDIGDRPDPTTGPPDRSEREILEETLEIVRAIQRVGYPTWYWSSQPVTVEAGGTMGTASDGSGFRIVGPTQVTTDVSGRLYGADPRLITVSNFGGSEMVGSDEEN
jgi:hypothetical protein